jgi:hypothetical protein
MISCNLRSNLNEEISNALSSSIYVTTQGNVNFLIYYNKLAKFVYDSIGFEFKSSISKIVGNCDVFAR